MPTLRYDFSHMYPIPGTTPISQPKTLYHYTTQTGYMGILGSQKIWATKINYLNDASEANYAIQVAKSLVDDFKKKGFKKIETLVRFIEETEWLNLGADWYVSSFSEKGDLLSQWRSYCPKGSGICLGFNRKGLRHLSENQDYSMIKCIYDQSTHRMLIKPILFKYIEKIQNLHSAYDGGEPSSNHMINADKQLMKAFQSEFLKIAIYIKNPVFSEEREWRIIVHEKEADGISYRQGNTMLIPYTTFMLSDENINAVSEIIIGPTLHPHLSLNSAKEYAQIKRVSDINFRISEIPYQVL